MKKFSNPLFIVVCFWACVFSHAAYATHVRAADIKVEVDCSKPRTYKITIVAYLNTQSNTRFGTISNVFFGDCTSVPIPVTTSTLRNVLGTNIAVATFTVTHTYAVDGEYSIAYVERDRSTGILNIANSDDVPYVTFVGNALRLRQAKL